MKIKLKSQNSRIKSIFLLLLIVINFIIIFNSSSPLSLFSFTKNVSFKKLISLFSPTMISQNFRNDINPAIAIDSKGVEYIVWGASNGSQYDIYCSNSLDNFAKNYTISKINPSENDYLPSITIDHEDIVHIAWYWRYCIGKIYRT